MLPASSPARPQPDALAPGTVVLAAVAGAHGVAGEVKLKLFTDDLASYRSFNNGALTLVAVRGTVARLAEATDRIAAEALRGTLLTVPRTALPPLGPDEYYHADLVGLAVETDAGSAVGRVVAVENFGAGDVLEIERAGGRRFMVPVRPEAVSGWNAERLVIAAAYDDG